MTAPLALVVGGSGFLGKHICAAFTGHGWQVISVSRRARAVPGCTSVGVRPHGAYAQFQELIDETSPQVVVNAAGAVWQPTENDLQLANVECADAVTRAVAGGRKPTRLIHLGSSLEYAPRPRGQPTPESTPTTPTSAYGRSKLAGSRLVLAAARGPGIDAVVLRVFNAIGPGQPASSMLGRAVAELKRAQAHGVRARLELTHQERDFVDVRDVAEAVRLSAVARAPVLPPVVNIGRGEAATTATLLGALVKISGVPADVRMGGYPDGPRGNALSWQRADINLAGRALGWRPRTALPTTLHDLWCSAPGHPHDDSEPTGERASQ
ncbi:NAD(P)-dependent oxidoreductase [Micromonospora sp. FIMYZ51]|uniref:NAD-dependent epimerase/dehydratase family protein n=1 Tax=Micromonospora sp. FIMYZ51 TaxID=3051832 RepID=UPI00311E4913